MLLPEVIQTKITPPKISSRILFRERVINTLEEVKEYRLTILQENAGNGKSTALASYVNQSSPAIWYQITEDDNNLPIFLLYLIQATSRALPEITNLPLIKLQDWDVNSGPLPSKAIINQFINAVAATTGEPIILILDDIHLVQDTPEIAHALDHLISLAPPNLHILMSSRYPIKLPNLYRWVSRGEVLTLDQGLLSFTPEEIALLYSSSYDYELLPDEIQDLISVTEGWALALQLIWQGLKSGAVATIEDALAYQASTMEHLFAVLTHEVLDKQPEDIQEFLRASSILRTMTPDVCNAIRQKDDSAAILAYLQRQDLFVVNTGNDILRYQHIFHQLLTQQTTTAERRHWHVLAADYYQAQENIESAIYHAFGAPDYTQAARLLVSYGEQLIRSGLLDTLSGYLEQLPPDLLLSHPLLLKYLGDIARFRSQYQEALGWYRQAESIFKERGETAEIGRALRGQARVYIDTVDPNKASEILKKALRISDGIDDRESSARLYELLAENKLNAGKLDEAEDLRRNAEALRQEGHSESQLLYRVLIRTGRLQEVKQKLEDRAKEEHDQPVQTSRSHRETQLLLSLIYSIEGNARQALETALDGTQRGEELGSPWVTAVGHMRQGHALMLYREEDSLARAKAQFEKAIEISRTLSTPRLRVEALWGLCRVYGFSKDLDQADQVANVAVKIANEAGDEWVSSLVRLAMGANLIQAGSYEVAYSWLKNALRGFQECSDPLGISAARLWICLGLFAEGNLERLEQEVPVLMETCQKNQYDFLFEKPTLLGLPDERACIPLLIMARDHHWGSSYARQLLSNLGLSGIHIHPGYQLRVETLGRFQAWRGSAQIPGSGWQRSKSRQLFQLLITHMDSPLAREQIYEFLWPGGVLDKTEQSFKVALSTLYRVLEPNRLPGTESAYIERQDCVYRIRSCADISIDLVDFENTIQAAEELSSRAPEQAAEHYKRALDLYQGEYLPDALYETWAATKREQLSVLFLRSADHLCDLYLKLDRPEDTVLLCQKIFEEDNCWERAYRHLMAAYDQLGEHGQIARTYQRCVQIMQDELGISPSSETKLQYQDLISAY